MGGRRPATGGPAGRALRRSGGQVAGEADCSAGELLAVAGRMRSIYHVLQELARFRLDEPVAAADPLERIRRELREREIPQLREAASFRVSCNRGGRHPFGSLEVQREAGAILRDRYGTRVDLEGYQLEVRVDILESDCRLRLQLTRGGLDRRFRRIYQPRVTLKTPVAWALLRLARLEALPAAAPRRLLDPFCGSGTIPIEAALLRPELEIMAGDRDPAAVEGTRRNAGGAGVGGRVEARLMDARDLGDLFPEGHFGAIVTDPPFGVRAGQSIDFADLYRKLVAGAHRVLAPNGRMALLVGRRRRAFTRAVFEHGGFSIRHARNVETSGIFPMLFVLERR